MHTNHRVVFHADPELLALIEAEATKDDRSVASWLKRHLRVSLGLPALYTEPAPKKKFLVRPDVQVVQDANGKISDIVYPEPAVPADPPPAKETIVQKGRFLKPAKSADSSVRSDGSPWADNNIEFREHLRGTEWNKMPYAELASSQRQRANAEDDERQASAT